MKSASDITAELRVFREIDCTAWWKEGTEGRPKGIVVIVCLFKISGATKQQNKKKKGENEDFQDYIQQDNIYLPGNGAGQTGGGGILAAFQP